MSGLAWKLYSYLTGGKKDSSADYSKYGTPLNIISLDPAKKIIVGREPAASEERDCVTFTLQSQKLPLMLSEQHASLAFAEEQKKWMIMDLKVCIHR